MKLGLTPFACVAALSFASACSSASPADLLGAASNGSPEADGNAPATGDVPSTVDASAGDATTAPTSNRKRDAGAGETDAGADATADAEAQYQDLPIVGGVDAPTVAAMTVRCATSRNELDSEPTVATFPAAFARIVSVTDPQGVSDVFFNSHQLVLFASVDGSGGEAHTFDASVYGITFGLWQLGTYFAGDTAALTELCARTWWPGEVTVTDSSGHVTKSKVRVPIVR